MNLKERIEEQRNDFISKRSIIELKLNEHVANYIKLPDAIKEEIGFDVTKLTAKEALPALYEDVFDMEAYVEQKAELNKKFEKILAVRNKYIEEALQAREEA